MIWTKTVLLFGAVFLYVFATTTAEEDNSTISLPFEVEETLLDLLNTTELDALDTSNRSIVPLYRKDLDEDYIAYYEIDLNGQYYFILSAGPKTGDFKESQSGPPPLPTKVLRKQAKKFGKECEKFYLLCSMGVYMCENVEGIAVAATYNWTYDTPVSDWKPLQKMVEDLKNSKNFSDSWDNVRNASQDDWKTTCQRQGKEEKPDLKKYNAKMISQGLTAKLPLENYTKVTIHADPPKKQKELCKILKDVCDGDSNEVNKELIKKSKCGIQFLEFQVKNDTGKNAKDLPFFFEIETNDGKMLIVHFYADLEKEDDRTGRPKKPDVFAIPDADNFPIYNQHMIPKKCYSGCVPVAWAMILAHYDRLAERNSRTNAGRFGKQCWSKADGNKGVAPQQLTQAVKKYVLKIRKTLKTYCKGTGGPTAVEDIGKIKDFTDKRNIKSKIYKNIDQRQRGDGLLEITAKILKKGYPVQVSILLSPTSGHAVAATQYREKKHTYKRCRNRRCRTMERVEKEVYLNMGWGGASNGWKKPNIYLVFALLRENENVP